MWNVHEKQAIANLINQSKDELINEYQREPNRDSFGPAPAPERNQVRPRFYRRYSHESARRTAALLQRIEQSYRKAQMAAHGTGADAGDTPGDR